MLTISGSGPMGLKVNKPRMFAESLGCKEFLVKGHVPSSWLWVQPYMIILAVHGPKRGSSTVYEL